MQWTGKIPTKTRAIILHCSGWSPPMTQQREPQGRERKQSSRGTGREQGQQQGQEARHRTHVEHHPGALSRSLPSTPPPRLTHTHPHPHHCRSHNSKVPWSRKGKATTPQVVIRHPSSSCSVPCLPPPSLSSTHPPTPWPCFPPYCLRKR